MNYMKVCKFLMVLVAMWGLVSCGWLGEDVDVAAGVILRYNNETEHLIQIKDVNAYGYNGKDVDILPGKYITWYGYEDWYNYIHPTISEERRYLQLARSMPSNMTIVWDGEYSLTYDITNHTDRLLVPELYSLIESSRNKLMWEYEYTFTEADYEYAKTYGEKMEN